MEESQDFNKPEENEEPIESSAQASQVDNTENTEDDFGVSQAFDPREKVALSGKELLESKEVEKIALEVIETENFDLRPAEVGYFLVYPHLSKTNVAKCMKCSREVKYYSGNDYLIEISGEVWDMLDHNAKFMLVYHELLHIQPVYNEKKEEWAMKTRPHDFGDFYEINDRHGSDWYKMIQTTVSSLYDMDPTLEGKISF
jgi:predicted metallopeptidase